MTWTELSQFLVIVILLGVVVPLAGFFLANVVCAWMDSR